MEELEKCWEALYQLRNLRDFGPTYPQQGVCSHVDIYCLRMYIDMVEAWPSYSGSRVFPVPNPLDRTYSGAADIYNDKSVNKWEGEYGRLRRDFVLHCITYIETVLEEEDGLD